MKVLYFVHSYNGQNGVSLHVANLVKNMPAWVQCSVIGGRGFPFPFFSSLRFPMGEAFEALQADFDIMHIHGYGNFYSFFGALACMRRKKKLVWTIHGYPKIRGARRIFYWVYRYLMAPFIFSKTTKIISVSEEAAQILKKETKKEIEVIPNGVDFGLFAPQGNYRDAKYVCYVGRLDEDKGVRRMLECSSLPLLFVGPDEDGMQGKLERMAQEKSVHAEFEEAAYEEMPSEYAKCRYVVLPSKYEGFPLTMLEAVACGRPFVCTDVGEVGKVMGTLFENPKKYILEGNLQEKIGELEKEELQEELQNARKNAREYSWKRVAQRVAAVYAAL